MIRKGTEVRLVVQPIYVMLHHDYVFEGPCRFGSGEQLTKEYDDMLNAERLDGMSSTVRQMLEEKVCLREPIVVYRSEEFLVEEEALEKMSKGSDEVDVYLVGELGRLTDLMIPFAQRVKKPLISVPDVRPMQTIMPASLMARGLEVHSFRNWDDTLAFLDVLRVKKVLARTKVLCAPRFGTARSVSGMDNFVDLEHVTKMLGTQFTFINPHELLDQSQIGDCTKNPTLPGRRGLNPTDEDIREMNAVTDKLMAEAAACDMSREDVFQSVRAYVANKKALDYYGCNAFCAPCPDICATRRFNEERYTFCLTHSLLGEQGIPSACEYDLIAVLSMMILSGFMYAPAYMGNTTHEPAKWKSLGACELHPMMHDIGDKGYKNMVMENDPENIIFTWHSVPKRNMKGFDAPMEPYALRPFTASGFGATIRYDFNRDIGTPVTMLRIDPACGKIFVAKGTVVAGRGYDDNGCSVGVFLKVADGRDFYAKQIQFGNHVPLVYGDCFDQACALGKLLGLEVVTA